MTTTCDHPPAAAEAYDLILLVDTRESFSQTAGGHKVTRSDSLKIHLSRLQGKQVPVDCLQLEQGDAMWVARSR